MLRERSKSCAAAQTEKHLPAEKVFERSASLPYKLEDAMTSNLNGYQLNG